MDRNSIIGMLLLVVLFFMYVKINAPTEAEIAEKRLQDSLAQAEQVLALEGDGVGSPEGIDTVSIEESSALKRELDSLRFLQDQKQLGGIANYLKGKDELVTLENDKIKVELHSKGARIKSVLLKEYKKLWINEDREEVYSPLYLLEDNKNTFDLTFDVNGRSIHTEEIFFEVSSQNTKSVQFRMSTDLGKDFIVSYSLDPEMGYLLDYKIQSPYKDKSVALSWNNYLDRIEDNTDYEKMYSSVYYRPVDDDTEHCSCTSEDKEELGAQPVQWVAHSNQFFNSTLISESGFNQSVLEIIPMEEDSEDLKLAKTDVKFNLSSSGDYNMRMYIGPNEFDNLRAMNMEMEYIIPFGSSIFGSINRWMIRPLFSFLTSIIGVKGLAIVLLTLLVKLLLYPFTFRMLKSQSKMAALKPVLAKIKEKTGGDAQAQQMETMKTYREYGVNPLGGCLPMVMQMPIWFALYRFFPASITFRQAPFLWAHDLSSYDVIAWLPFNIPFYGDHVSLFTILWAISLIVYTYYNSRFMDYSAQPAMKYMQYFMPLMFLFYFNNFASGLSCYLFFSNIFNITQTLVTKNYIIDQEKLKDELRSNKDNPKKKSSFQQRMEKALKEQQKLAEQRQKDKSKKKK